MSKTWCLHDVNKLVNCKQRRELTRVVVLEQEDETGAENSKEDADKEDKLQVSIDVADDGTTDDFDVRMYHPIGLEDLEGAQHSHNVQVQLTDRKIEGHDVVQVDQQIEHIQCSTIVMVREI